MYGHGAVPPTRSAGTVITLRVLLAACCLVSCGFLACVPLFRVGILRGRWIDWAVAWVSVPLSIACFAVIGTLPENNMWSNVALTAVLMLGAVSTAYFLVTDIQFHNNRRAPAGYAPPHAQTVPTAYGYPQPASPYLGAPQTQPPLPHPPMPQSQPQHPMAQTYIPSPPPQSPPPQAPAPARIDQVRAELDELSDYLRKHDGHEGGR